MAKMLLVSNRLPVSVRIGPDGQTECIPSIGGLATGLRSFHEEGSNLWVGWPGITREEAGDRQEELTRTLREDHRCIPVWLGSEDLDAYYNGFSNSTIWPLFHYFPNLTTFDEAAWEAYNRVNRDFCDTLVPLLGEDDILWIHDYQLMLVPQMVREARPGCRIGFFLHIPFPSFELFRLLPWRTELLDGLLGADLLGFHTYDYARHFLSSVRRISGLEHEMNCISFRGRTIQVDVFPMGIDWDYFSRAHERPEIRQEVGAIIESTKGTQVVLSIDRLDFTKGIPSRLRAFDLFLRNNPEYRGKVTLILIVAPSRTGVDLYDTLRREIQELVSGLNGRYGQIGWTPVWFFFRSFTQDQLIAFYRMTDVMLVTPLRDGMNLVAKEFLATRSDRLGVLVISETTGAASELGEALVVNPHDIPLISRSLKTALEMTKREQIGMNTVLRQRIERYDVRHWARDFRDKLLGAQDSRERHPARDITLVVREELKDAWKGAPGRLLLLDWDGTLTPIRSKPSQAAPDAEITGLLQKLCRDARNHVVIISGRDHETLESWLGGLDATLVAGHGLWVRNREKREWDLTEMQDSAWKALVRPIMELYMDRTPGSLLEEKEYSLAWHYRNCEPDLARIRLAELKEALVGFTRQSHLALLDGKKVLEVKDGRVNKGRTASGLLAGFDGLVLAAGDDVTDEDLFGILGDSHWSIRIGDRDTRARFRLEDPAALRSLLAALAGE